MDNESGVLARVIGMIAGRGYNIESLTVSEVDRERGLSRINLTTIGTHQVIEQVKMKYLATDRDPALRSENTPDVWSGSYAVAGGDSIGSSGLLPQVEAALAPYKNWSAG